MMMGHAEELISLNKELGYGKDRMTRLLHHCCNITENLISSQVISIIFANFVFF
jgi:hypothetical protein